MIGARPNACTRGLVHADLHALNLALVRRNAIHNENIYPEHLIHDPFIGRLLSSNTFGAELAPGVNKRAVLGANEPESSRQLASKRCKTIVIGARHTDVDIVIPGDESLVANSAKQSAGCK